MGNFTIKINHLTQINVVMLVVNSECLKSISAASKHLSVSRSSCSDHFFGAATLTVAITALLFAQPSMAGGQLSQLSLKCGGTSRSEGCVQGV